MRSDLYTLSATTGAHYKFIFSPTALNRFIAGIGEHHNIYHRSLAHSSELLN
jgi:hypothetical protein